MNTLSSLKSVQVRRLNMSIKAASMARAPTQQVTQQSLDFLLTRYDVLHYSIEAHKVAANDAIHIIDDKIADFDRSGSTGELENMDGDIEALKDAHFNVEVEEGSKADIEINFLRHHAVSGIGRWLPLELEDMIRTYLLCDWEAWRKPVEEKLNEAEDYKRGEWWKYLNNLIDARPEDPPFVEEEAVLQPLTMSMFLPYP